MNKSVFVIIRSAGERTESACEKLITDQGIKKSQIKIIREVPFSASLRKSFKLGIESGFKWTYCIDADVLMRENSIGKMVEYAEKQGQSVCEIQGFVFDKYFGGLRKAGNHLYRSSLLNKALECIPEEGEDIRPERYTLQKLSEKGYQWKAVPNIVGIHDDEQYNKDVYRKAFVHGVKHVDRLPLFVSLWKDRLSTDPDFEVALAALADSIKTNEQLFINSEQDIYSNMFKKSGFKEKNEMSIDEISLEKVEKKIGEWVSPQLYFSYFPTRDGYDSALSGLLKKVHRLNKRYGPAELVKIGIKKIAR
jgi:hypothetical protein